jgi:glutaredoxin
MVQVLIYSKPGCHLCDDVKDRLHAMQQHHDFELREINILEDQAAFEQFQYEIPVVFINGKKAFKYFFDEKQFLTRIQGLIQ